MNSQHTDILIVGAGPVGMLCAVLARRWGLSTLVVDRSPGALTVGRADALNARTLQLLALVDLFDPLYPLGKACNTSSVWQNGGFVSRQSHWWHNLEGCLHKHFLMLGQAHVEQALDRRLQQAGHPVLRATTVDDIALDSGGCSAQLSNGQTVQARFVIGADGAQSFVRQHFAIPFPKVRPEMIWAVIDGVIATDFPKVPEIISFQAETADVAWIPREGNIDRFYVRMDREIFSLEDAVHKINIAMAPKTLRFTKVEWFSRFTVKEAVAEKFSVANRIFLAGDACHVHSVNGGQGLNTGISDAFNLIWKLALVHHHGAPSALLESYEQERKQVAEAVIATSGELVRSTKYAAYGEHANDYLKIVEKRAGNITGMGIRYGTEGLTGSRLFDFEVFKGEHRTRMYALLDYGCMTLLVFSRSKPTVTPCHYGQTLWVGPEDSDAPITTADQTYQEQLIWVRPDSYIAEVRPAHQIIPLSEPWKSLLPAPERETTPSTFVPSRSTIH